MTHPGLAGVAVAGASSVLYIALGAWVWSRASDRPQTRLLAVFAVLFGLWFAAKDVLPAVHAARGLVWPAFSVAGAVVGVVSVALASAVPEPLDDRQLLGRAAFVGFAFAVPAVITYRAPVDTLGWIVNATFWQFIAQGATWTAAIVLALRAHPARAVDRSDVTQLAVLAVGFALFWEFLVGANVVWLARDVAVPDLVGVARSLTQLAVWLVVAGLWGRNMVAAGDDARGVHRTAMLAILGLMALGALTQAVVGDSLFWLPLLGGVVRTLGVGLLAYGVLRHDLAGLDAKVEWTVSKTTVAGIFVAVFFVVSEGAQVLFAGFADSELLGIIAAGALLFALSPIQRAADTIAERAVPSTHGSASEGPTPRAEETYKEMLRKFLADDDLSRDEEKALADLAGELGIDPGRAFELREEVEDEVLGGDTS